MDKLKAVKSIVFILTFLLVFGSLVFLGSLFKKTHKASQPLPADITLEQPAGSSIQNIVEQGGYLYILIKDGGLSDRIVIFDSKLGQKVSIIKVD